MKYCIICGKQLKPNHKKTCSISCRGKYIGSKNKGRVAHNKGVPMSKEQKVKCSIANKGKHYSPKTEFTANSLKQLWANPFFKKTVSKKISNSRKGMPLSDRHKKALCGPRPHLRGENSPSWKGGYKSDRGQGRLTEYKVWRHDVFVRDNFTCKLCGIRGGKLEAHHIERWRDNIELRFDIANGITLCKKCHNKIKNKEKQYECYFKEAIKISNKLGTAT